MTDDKLAEIRARHEQDQRQRDANGPFYMQVDDMHEDRAALLGMVEALRRERDEALASEARLIEAMIMELASERPSEKIMREALQQCGCTPAAAGIAGAAWRKLAALAASERGS